MASLFTLVLATTPYIWWHGVLPFLDLATAVFFSTGTLYWYFWIKKRTEGTKTENKGSAYAAISGTLLGLAAWTRLEFLLYDLIPVFLTVYVFIKYPEKENSSNQNSLKLFFLCLLMFPSIWFLNLLTFDMPLWNQIKILAGICGLLWVLALYLTWGRWKISESSIRMGFVFCVAIYFLVLFMLGAGQVPTWKKIAISLYRTSTVHIFYLFTTSFIIFVFFEKLKDLSEQKKMLGGFLILFLFVHLAIFSYLTPKWGALGEFINATFFQPGDSVNLSDSRAMMAVYPIFIFFISLLPFVRRGMENE